MKRITISLPDDLAAALERESERERTSVSAIARKAIQARLRPLKIVDGKREVPFASLGSSGYRNTARDMEEIMAKEWTKENLIDRNR
jgi:metal-responsive CopG/Arc/MetJ family transcriptional regulator